MGFQITYEGDDLAGLAAFCRTLRPGYTIAITTHEDVLQTSQDYRLQKVDIPAFTNAGTPRLDVTPWNVDADEEIGDMTSVNLTDIAELHVY